MADNTRAAQMEERIRNLQASHTTLQETSEQHGALLNEVLQRVNELRTVLQEKDDQAKQHRGPTGPSFGYTGGIQTRTMKLDFPHFDGTNPSGWLFKAKQYFAYHQVPVEQWLTVASLNMNADALEWYQWYMEYKPKASWEDFVAAMDSRFGPPRRPTYIQHTASRTKSSCQAIKDFRAGLCNSLLGGGDVTTIHYGGPRYPSIGERLC
ncbi:hypothetical protein MRB53_013005 [Persea americana]|uniref:Uncharacterized protein n=1 Tax=Persea americana TaxID=3435 RepID=A0ACC2LZC6_PERAE|nr:hypothetical protein MRB53_013005 [Persea americana]